jgi:hypothetical protein
LGYLKKTVKIWKKNRTWDVQMGLNNKKCKERLI